MILDVAYPTGWDADVLHGASRNVLYDALVGLTLAGLSEKAHTSLTDVITNQHHVKTVASELNLADLNEKSYNSLTDKLDLGIGIASAVVVHSNDGTKTTPLTTYQKLKEITSKRNLSGVRVQWGFYNGSTVADVVSKLYINGGAVGVEHETDQTTEQTVSDDIIDIVVGDLIQIYAKRVGAGMVVVKNMKICYDGFLNNDP